MADADLAAAPPPLHGPTPEVDSGGWQPLPERARGLFVAAVLGPSIGIACGLSVPTALVVLHGLLDVGRPLAFALAFGIALPLAALLAFGLGRRLHRRLLWRTDAGGLTVRRGAWWLRETHVPATRVQHLDLTRGPLQRRRALATLVLHTAGTRMGAVTVPNLDEADAERLRDALARQHAHDADDA